ncbi:MAG: hydrogenase maturation nickel metallochaperone HypA [Actinomycetota bacterium]|nr:hydrogenase maturation nickel metallochaperone HypA [Actinomycetota bacterium]
MHELSIAEAIARKVRQRAAGRPVSAVAIRVGHFRQVVPDSLEFCWTMITQATGLEGCRLEIEQVPATARCAACDAITTLEIPILRCRSCGGSNVTLLTGRELIVVSLEILEVC